MYILLCTNCTSYKKKEVYHSEMDRRRKPKKKLKDFGREYFLNISVNALKHIIRAKNVGER